MIHLGNFAVEKRKLTKRKLIWIAVVVLTLYAGSLYFIIVFGNHSQSLPLWILLLSTFNNAVFLKGAIDAVKIKRLILFSFGTLFFATVSIMTIFHLG